MIDELNIELLRKLCKERNIIYSAHSLERLHERAIFRKDIINAIMNGEIIEQYPDDRPYPSCLIFGLSEKNEKLHVVCGCDDETVIIITAYRPTLEKFEDDYKTRKEHN